MHKCIKFHEILPFNVASNLFRPFRKNGKREIKRLSELRKMHFATLQITIYTKFQNGATEF